MRFMVMVKSDPEAEAGVPPSAKVIESMGRYNEELVKAGVLLDANGLRSSSEGALVSFSNGVPTVLDGPFTEAKELVAGYWVLEVKSREEVIEWIKRLPADPDTDFEVEIRPLYEGEEFGDAYTDEIRERQERMAAKISEQHG